ncbi:serine hydrolase domain-containing protein [Luminiphilus sp. nBUS_16]|uniref:serine hydrolase domain-containing protein n=1 Tax=Luminiphilus sp. nBUS_16 TaxID=3395315 RepID=UPI003EC0F3C2
MLKQLLGLLIALNFAALTWSAETPSLSADVDAIFADYNAAGVPGCAIGVIQNGAYIHAKGYGSANLEHGIPIGSNSVFRIGSVSKQFTAAAVAILADRGVLSLDADIHQYLPDLKEYNAKVTVRQMIHHLSGMGDYEMTGAYEIAPGKAFRFGNEDYWTIEEFYQRVRKQPLASTPMQHFEYSNVAYFLLSQVIDQVSGLSLRAFAEKELFGPLNMTATFFNDNVNGVVPHRADGYTPVTTGSFEILMTNLDWVGDGGVYTTLNDFIKWDQALITGNLPGGVALRDLLLEPHPLTKKTMTSVLLDDGAGYGFGIEIGHFKGIPAHVHTGSWVGFRALYARFPENNISVMAFCNRDDLLREGDKRRELLDLVTSKLLHRR